MLKTMRPPQPPRIAIAGAGAVGCYLGGHLARHAEVTLIGRDHVLDPIRERGLTISGEGAESFVIGPEELGLTDDPAAVADADYVLVTTKYSGTATIARAMAPHLRSNTALVGLQNGLHGADIVREQVDHQLVVAGMVPFNIARLGPASYLRASSGTVVIDADPRLTRLVRALRDSAIHVRTSRDMQAVLHGKVLLNLNNAIQGLSGLPLRTELLDRHLRRCTSMCMAEANRVFKAAGVIPRVPLAVPAAVLPRILRLPTPIYRTVAGAALRVDELAVSSMGDDLARGRPTEIAILQGEVSEMGRRLGVPTPVNDRVVELVHRAEREGPNHRRWTGRSLVAELQAARTRSH